MVDQEFAPATVRKAYQILSKALRSAVDAGYLSQTPCRGISLPVVERKEMNFLTPEQVSRLAKAIDPRYRALVLLGAYGGLRWSEMVGLRRSRFDELKGAVRITETIVEVNGAKLLPPGPPKTKAGRRTVTLPRTVARELGAHIKKFSKTDSNELVFQSPKGSALRKSAFRQRVWIPALKEAGLGGLRVHDLRHTAVAFWIAAGAHVKEIQVRAGHSSAAVVLDRYGHLLPASDERVAERLETLLTSTTATGEVVPLKRTK